MEKTETINQLPSGILNPLRIAFLALFVFVGGFLLWAVFAPLASTIHTSGNLSSSLPNYELQHSYGGRIAKVHVQTHDLVHKGEPLIRFDVSNQARELSSTQEQADLLRMENAAIELVLTDDLPASQAETEIDKQVLQRFIQQQDSHGLELAAILQDQESATRQIQNLSQQVATLGKRLGSAQYRYSLVETLSQKGLAAKSDRALMHEQILEIEAEITTTNAQLYAKQDEVGQLANSLVLTKSRFRQTLMEQAAQNEKQILQLEQVAQGLTEQVNQADVLAPISGIVSSLDFDTQEMYAGRGATLLTLARPLKNPRVTLTIPTHAIDQIAVGRSGKVTIPSLPQRNLPAVRAVLVSISPEAQRDADGNPVGYKAMADINPQDLIALKDNLKGQLSLTTDMPVSVGFEGRKTTLAQYLVSPFFAVFDNALVD